MNNDYKQLILQQQTTINNLLNQITNITTKQEKKLPDMTLTEAVEIWKDYADKYYPKTAEVYYKRYPFIFSYFPGKTLRTLNKQDIMNFINIRKKEGIRQRKKTANNSNIQMIQQDKPVSNSTINRNIFLIANLYRAVRTMLPVDYEDIQSPTRSFPKLPVKKKKGKFYTEQELLLLGTGGSFCLSADQRDKNRLSPVGSLVMLLCKTGCRVGEAIKLKWENVSLDERKISFIDTKTHTDRDVPMTGYLFDFLKTISFRSTQYEYVITTTRGTNYKNYPRDVIKRYIQNCGIEFKGVHSIRHGVITALRKRYGERLTKPIAGHSIKSVHELYTHHEWEELVEAVKTLDFFEKKTI